MSTKIKYCLRERCFCGHLHEIIERILNERPECDKRRRTRDEVFFIILSAHSFKSSLKWSWRRRDLVKFLFLINLSIGRLLSSLCCAPVGMLVKKRTFLEWHFLFVWNTLGWLAGLWHKRNVGACDRSKAKDTHRKWESFYFFAFPLFNAYNSCVCLFRYIRIA